MEDKKELAFPLTDGQTFATDGMTKRFYAACAAMQGLCALPNKGTFESLEQANELLVKQSYAIADELLKQENEQ